MPTVHCLLRQDECFEESLIHSKDNLYLEFAGPHIMAKTISFDADCSADKEVCVDQCYGMKTWSHAF